MQKIELCGYSDCTGCRACGDVCPKRCISFVEDEEGFYTPHINSDECIECGKCMKTCPIISPPQNNNTPTPKTYHAYSLNKEIAKTSSSGGIFAEFAIHMLSNGGAVCGAAQESGTLKIKHIAVTSESELRLLQGSKYVQSDTTNIYSEALSLLKQGIYVLFSGTPCQVAAMKNIAGTRFKNHLYLVEIICHGVPSYSFFKEYIRKATDIKVIERFNFKDNIISDYNTSYQYKASTKIKYLYGYKDLFMKAFLHGDIFQERCYTCPFAHLPRQADITLGDFWGIENYAPKKDINRYGNSLLLINNDTGQLLLNAISHRLFFHEHNLSNAKKRNHNIYEPSKRPQHRDNIYSDLMTKPLKYVAIKYNHTYTLRNYVGMIVRRYKHIVNSFH